MKKIILFFTIVFILLMSGGNAAGEARHSLEDPYIFRWYLDQGQFPLTRLALRDPLANLLYDLHPAISRTRFRSFFVSSGAHSFSGISGHHNRLGFFDHQSQVYFDRGFGPFVGLAPRNPSADFLFDQRAGISRFRYRSFFASYANYSYRKFPGRSYRRNLYDHQYRMSYNEFFYRYGYTQSYYNHQMESNYYKRRPYRNQSTYNPFPYRYHSGVKPYGSGFSVRGRFR